MKTPIHMEGFRERATGALGDLILINRSDGLTQVWYSGRRREAPKLRLSSNDPSGATQSWMPYLAILLSNPWRVRPRSFAA